MGWLLLFLPPLFHIGWMVSSHPRDQTGWISSGHVTPWANSIYTIRIVPRETVIFVAPPGA